jgi:hypothetical protein
MYLMMVMVLEEGEERSVVVTHLHPCEEVCLVVVTHLIIIDDGFMIGMKEQGLYRSSSCSYSSFTVIPVYPPTSLLDRIVIIMKRANEVSIPDEMEGWIDQSYDANSRS